MAKRKQEIKIILHTPTEMDAERQRRVEDFWIEKMVNLIENFSPNENERKYLLEQVKERSRNCVERME